MAMSGCYGEPIFNRLFGEIAHGLPINCDRPPRFSRAHTFVLLGVAVAYFIITIPSFPKPYREGQIYIDAPLALSFAFQTLALVVALVAAMAGGFEVRSWLGSRISFCP